MIKKVSALLLFSMLFVSNAFAHVMSSEQVFTDISYSEAKDDILLLNALGIVSYQNEKYLFRPQDLLTKQELASWAGSYYGLEGETSEQLAEAALAAGYLFSLNGMTTYADVNQAFFKGQLPVDNVNGVLTREQFARFIATNANTDINGQTLYEISNFTAGPVGKIESVNKVKKLTPEGEMEKVYELTIDGKVYELGLHPRVIAQATDPAVWTGMFVTQSWIGPNVMIDDAGHAHHEESSHSNHKSTGNTISMFALQFIQIGDEIDNIEDAKNEANDLETAATEVEKNSNSWMFMTAAVLVVAAVIFIIMNKRKKG